MPGTAGPRLGLVWGYSPGEIGWGVAGFNPNFARLEALVSLTIIEIATTPPGSPVNGDCYIVGTGGSGVFLGHDDDVAFYYTVEGWGFINPVVGLRAFNLDDDTYYRFDGVDWIVELAAIADVSGPASAVDGNAVAFDGPSGKVIKDSGKAFPGGSLVGDDDAQILTNKVIDGADNSLVVYLDTDVVGNLDPDHLNGGLGATSATAWFGDGTWKPVATTAAASVTVADTPPSLPNVGDLWFDSADTISLYIWMDDGSSAQWVPACTCSPDGGGGGGLLAAVQGEQSDQVVAALWSAVRALTAEVAALKGKLG
jgi:hypothetical protein